MRRSLPALAAALAVTAVVSVPAQTAEGRDVYYRSNEIGIEFEEIPQAAAAEHRFVLVHRGAVEGGDGAGEERLLLDGGRQVRRWVTLRDAGGTLIAESDYADGMLVAERSFDDTGKLTEVSEYDRGVLASRAAYAYEPRMVRVVVTGSDGAVLQTATYELAATGQLRDFARVEPGADRLGVRFVFAGGTLVEEASPPGRPGWFRVISQAFATRSRSGVATSCMPFASSSARPTGSWWARPGSSLRWTGGRPPASTRRAGFWKRSPPRAAGRSSWSGTTATPPDGSSPRGGRPMPAKSGGSTSTSRTRRPVRFGGHPGRSPAHRQVRAER